MALYKDLKYLTKTEDAAFEAVHPPGGAVPFSGIYRCEGCGHEVVAEHARQFPPQNHPQHAPAQGAIRWRLIVFAQHKQ
jgi:hypothetical protein